MNSNVVTFRHLCLLTDSEDTYTSLAETLYNHENSDFIRKFVEHLSYILLTGGELAGLREKLAKVATKVSFKIIDFFQFISNFS